MRTLIITLCLVLFSQTIFAQEEKSITDSVSYSLGILVAQNLKKQGMQDINAAELAAGVQDVLNDVPKMDVMQANAKMQEYMQQLSMAEHKDNMDAGAAFLKENGARPEVTTTASGLQYEVITEGDGPKPTASDEVTVHYHGTLIDGTVFDSSVDRGSPTSFPLGRVIAGWTEGLQLMPVGSKYRFVIPYDLAYGDRKAGQKIKPYSTLIFEVELLSIK